MSDLCAVVLAAGEGRRLRPLTELLPKALCPVGNVPLLDHALDRLARLGLTGPGDVAVNACYHAEQLVAAVGDRAHVSVEPGPLPLGTAAGLVYLRDWIAGRGVLVCNADAYLSDPDLSPLVLSWDGEETRLLGVPTRPDDVNRFGRYRFAGCSLLPWSRVATLPSAAELVAGGEPVELVKPIWRRAEADGELRVVEYHGHYLDTGTPADYLAANLHAAGPGGLLVAPDAVVSGSAEHAVIGAGAVVEGTVERCVVWPGARVGRGERLRGAIRYGASGTVSAEYQAEGAPE